MQMEEKCKIEFHDICNGSTSQLNLIKTISSIELALLVTLSILVLRANKIYINTAT